MNDYDEAIRWARGVMAADPSSLLILDTETTDLGGEIVDLAIIDLSGAVVFQSLFNPILTVDPGAEAIHGLSNERLKSEPLWQDKWADVLAAIGERRVLIYNARFDNGRLYFTCTQHGVDPARLETTCVMEWYSQFCGEWNNYHGNYRWQKLPGGDHTALGDCLATLDVIKQMAAAKMSEERDGAA